MVQATEHLGVGAKIQARQVEEGDHVAVTKVEEKVGGSGIVPILEHVGQGELQHVLVEAHRPFDIG